MINYYYEYYYYYCYYLEEFKLIASLFFQVNSSRKLCELTKHHRVLREPLHCVLVKVLNVHRNNCYSLFISSRNVMKSKIFEI